MSKPYSKLWDDPSLRPYLGEIARRYGIVETLALPSMRDLPPVRIEQLFVQPLLAEVPVSADSDPKNWPKGESLLQVLGTSPQLVVLGDPGGGKSTLANWLTWRLSSGLTAPLPEVLRDRVPIPCVLRDMPVDVLDNDTSLSGLARAIAHQLLGKKVNPAMLASLDARIAQGDFVLILDGVDEIPLKRRERVGLWMSKATTQSAVVFATSRIVGYEDLPVDRGSSNSLNLTMAGVLSLHDLSKNSDAFQAALRNAPLTDFVTSEGRTTALPLIPWAQRRYLMPFDQSRIDAFAINWYRQRIGTETEARQKADDLLASLAKSEVTRTLARTPNLLSLMAIVHRERTHLPDGKALLYEEIANAYINTIDSQRRIESDDALAPYTWKERKAWLAYIGFQMQLRRHEHREDEEEHQEKGVLADAQEVENWLMEAMRTSGVKDPAATAKMYMHWVARRSGLLLPRGEGRYAFVHLSFQEYFCASFLADRFTSRAFARDELPDDAPVTRDRMREWSYSAVWQESLVNLFELLSERDPEWADDLSDTLFGYKEASGESAWPQAALMVRTFTDRHIRLAEPRKQSLAARCAEVAWFQLRNWQLTEETDVVLPMMEAGYGALFSNRTLKEETDAGLPVRPLEQFTSVASEGKLVFARVVGEGFHDCTPIAGLTRLRFLDLSQTQVADCSSLARLSKLQSLDLGNTGVTDCTFLTELSELKTLGLNNTQVTKYIPLAMLSQLRSLNLSDAPIDDWTFLADLKQLDSLFLTNTKMVDCAPLAGLDQLQYLLLNNTQVADCAPLAGLGQLKYLFLNDTQVSDCTPLAGLDQLTFLFLSNTRIADCSPLANLKKLQYLHLGNTRVSDCTPLASLNKLKHLDLSNTLVTDVSSLAGLAQLQHLDLSNTQVMDISALEGIVNLKVTGVAKKAKRSKRTQGGSKTASKRKS